jgi:exosortase/archaeosortase family protein
VYRPIRYIKSLNAGTYLRFPLRFFPVYLSLHFLYLAIISASHPLGKLYSPFVIEYLNIINGVRNVLLAGSEFVLSIFGFASLRFGEHGLAIVNGGRVHLNNGCLAWGIMAFWVAFVFANEGSWRKKGKWMLAGVLAICVINIGRVVVLLIALTRSRGPVLSLDQHTVFNVVAYVLVFGMMYLYIRKNNSTIGQFDHSAIG